MKILHQGDTAYHLGESLGSHCHDHGDHEHSHSHEGGEDERSSPANLLTGE